LSRTSELDFDGNNGSALCMALRTDRLALDHLFASCIPQLRRTATRLLQNPQDSEEALQDALLCAYRKLNQFRGGAKFSTWLHRIVVNAALRKIQRSKSKLTSSIDGDGVGENGEPYASRMVDPRPNPEEEYATQERARILAAILHELPASHRRVVLLVDIEGLGGQEAADRLGISLSALKARHHRARRSMQRKARTAHAASDLNGYRERGPSEPLGTMQAKYPPFINAYSGSRQAGRPSL
jgi:RNA polymerase sigma-70 factor, ECF subfamily